MRIPFGAAVLSIENCKALKYVVQDLIESKWLNFKEDGPNISTNPLPGHGKSSVNAIEDIERQAVIKKVRDIHTPLDVIHAKLYHFGIVEKECAGKDSCNGPRCIGTCEVFKHLLQDLLDRHIIQIGFQNREENVLTLLSNNAKGTDLRKPLEICYSKDSKMALTMPQAITIQVPAPFPFKKANAVPWNYGVKVQNNPDVTNIAGSSGMTRSGRIYTPEGLSGGRSKDEEERARKGKGIEGELADNNMGKKALSEQEACEFLKLMRQSEYRVVDQLNHTPAKISLLSLLLNSEAHRMALMKVLNEAHVTHDITVDQLDGIVGNIVASNYLTFTDDEIPIEGRGHNKALHISVKCGEYSLARVLIDNGSSLNVLPKSTMEKLSVDGSYMRPSSTIVRAFDGSKRDVMGEMEIPIQVGPEVFVVNFQVMDIASSYSCLLGRPWIHTAGAVPSSLHQKLKFIINNKLVVVSGEEEMLVIKPSPARYIDAAEDSFETAFQALEIANATFIGEGNPLSAPKLSKTALMIARVMRAKGYQVGSGLGKTEQGILTPIELRDNKDRYGMGYQPDRTDRKRVAQAKKERRIAKLEGREPNEEKIPICDIKQSFKSAGMLNPNQITAVEDDRTAEDGVTDFVRLCPANERLKNWEIVEFPMFLSSK